MNPASPHRRGAPAAPLQQGGVALVTAMLVVALATVAAVAMASRQQIDVRRTANLIQGDQVLLYVLGVEGWAGQLLARDREDNDSDDLSESWAQRLPPIPVEGGEIAGEAIDLQGRFNLNSLVREDNSADPLAVARFQRLLTALDLDPAIATALVDFIDENEDPAPEGGGAEDGLYLTLDPAYRTANRRLSSVSELRLVAGVTKETFEKLAPLVSALPEPTAINVNTAPGPVLAALVDGISASEGQEIADERGTKGYENVEKFLANERFAGHQSSREGLSVSSRYFMVTSIVQIGRSSQRWHSLLVRGDQGEIRILQRSQSID